MGKKIKEFVVKFQRTRISDCTRLMFSPNRVPGWYDIDSDSYIQPIYEIPREHIRGRYIISIAEGIDFELDTDRYKTYNDLVREVCKFYNSVFGSKNTRNLYLWAIHFNPNKTGWIEINKIGE